MCGHGGGVLCVDMVTMYNSSINRCGLVWGPDTITKGTGTIVVPRPVWSKSHNYSHTADLLVMLLLQTTASSIFK